MGNFLGCDCGVDDFSAQHGYRLLGNDARPLTDVVRKAYQGGKELGRGLTAVVKRCRIPGEEFRGPVAIKKIDKTSHFTPVIRKTVQHEIKILKLIREKMSGHRHVCEFFGAYESDKSIYIVEELLNGGELFEYITLQPGDKFEERTAAILLSQIGRGLTALHTFGVVHRDLKPENIALKHDKSQPFPQNSLKIMDFGFSLMHGVGCEGSDPENMMVVGSPQYMAPEIVQAYFDGTSPKYTPKADVWALGVILFVLLCGRMPFETRRGNILDAHRAVVSKKPAFDCLRRLSHGANDLVRRMLRRDPSRRIALVDVLKHPWVVDDPTKVTKAVASDLDESERLAHMKRIRGRKRFMKATVAVAWGVRRQIAARKKNRSAVTATTEISTATMPEATLRSVVSVAALRTLRDSIDRALRSKTQSSKVATKDEGGSGSNVAGTMIDSETFAVAMRNAGEPWTGLDHDALFGAFDRDRSGSLDWRELVVGILGVLPPSADRLRACFVLCDVDGSGNLEASELAIVLKHATLRMSDPVAIMRRFRDALASCDMTVKEDDSCCLSCDQFHCAIEHDPELYEAFVGTKRPAVSTTG
eukprot:g5312.t1